MDRCDKISAVRILDCFDHQFLEAIRPLLFSISKIPKRAKHGSPEPAESFLPANPLAASQRKSRSARTAITREIAFAAGRSAARDEYHDRVTTLEAQVQTLQAELTLAHTELSRTQDALAATRGQLAAAQLNQAPPRPPVAPASPYLQKIPRKQP